MLRDADRDWRTLFEETYGNPPSRVEERVWREVYGDEYPEGVDPHSFVSLSELRRFVRDLRLEPGQRLVDVGCGRGGAGLWVAAATGATLTGLDIAEAPLVDARARAAAMGLDAEFRRGEFEATGLPSGGVDAVMSVDALLFTPSKGSALVELRRIMRPGGRLAFTSWDYHRQPVGRPPQVPDHRPLLEAAGFTVLAYEETDDWRARGERTHRGLLDAVEELGAETGEPVEAVREGILTAAATIDAITRRIFAVADAV